VRVGDDDDSMVTNSYYRGAQGVVLVYDIADKESFKALDRWLEELDTYTSKETNRVIIGNKARRAIVKGVVFAGHCNQGPFSSLRLTHARTQTDLGVKRAVAASVGKEFAEARGIPFFEASAKSGDNVDKVFVTLAGEIHERTGEGVAADASASASSKVKLKNPSKPAKAKGGCSV
jgi:Ras-related protein Rab-1A